jgi:TetR/AcrR family transcriptional repressor of nem operon
MRAGRPKAFDERQALEQAMQLFWAQGYEGTGMSELLERMGISRQSLYDTFGNKRQLFIRAIGHYRDTQLSQALELLQQDGAQVENVKSVVRFFERLASDDRCCGCLVANALVEVAPHDEEIADLLRETLELLRASIQRSLKQAQDAGELAPTKSPLQLSRAITNALLGLAVTGKLRLGRQTLRDVYAGTLSMLD